MSKEKIIEDMYKGVEMFLKELGEVGAKGKMSMDEAMDMSDILKDMSEVLKNISKANYYDRKVN